MNAPPDVPDAPWWSGGLRFQCLPGCGRCCGGEPGAIFFTPEEGERAAAHLGIDMEHLRVRYVTMRWGEPSFRERANGDCVFFDPELRQCAIYPVRPAQCRSFPFWEDVLASPEAWEAQARRCPGMGEGPLLSMEEILDRIRAAATWTQDES